MRSKILFIFLIISTFCSAQSVPNTNTFSLQDVINIIGGESLDSAFFYSVQSYFDTNNKGNEDRLSNFKNYKYPKYVTLENTYNITTSSFSVNCQSNQNNDEPITERGICWSTSINPITSNSHTVVSGNVGSYNSTASGLNSGTTYYVRAYIITSVETTYSNEAIVNTLQDPTVVATFISPYIKVGYLDCLNSSGNVPSTATFRSTVSSSGTSITNSGLIYSLTDFNPNINTGTVVSSGISGDHTDCLVVSGLQAGKVYAFRAWALSSLGYTYSDVELVTTEAPVYTPPSIGSEIDGGTIISIVEDSEGYDCLIASDILEEFPLHWFNTKDYINAVYTNESRTDATGSKYRWWFPSVNEAKLIRTYQQSFTFPSISPLNIPINRSYWTSYQITQTILAPFRIYKARKLDFSNNAESDLISAYKENYFFVVKYYYFHKQ